MFWISKKTATFKDVWKDGFVDIHNHLLPGIDDGAKTIAHTQEMIDGMQALGITEAIATPHTYSGMWPNTPTSIRDSYALVSHSFITGYSSEYFADSSLLELVEHQELLPLKNDYLLVEFSMMSAPVPELKEVLFALKLKGYRIILAHPERYLYWEKTTVPFEELKSFDIEFQLNTLSLLGHYGERCKKLAEHLLKNDFYEFLGTDFHHIRHIQYVNQHTFAEQFMKKIMPLVAANQQFSAK